MGKLCLFDVLVDGEKMDNWYILYVKANREEKINQYLKTKGIDVFVPKRDVIYKRCNKKFLVRKLLFTNYIFVRSNLDQSHFIYQIKEYKNEVEGIIRVLTYDKTGTPALNDQEKAFFKKLLGVHDVVTPSVGYIENDKVVITEGPLLGMESKIVSINKHKKYAKIVGKMFERDIIVEVSLDIVKKLESY
ncbi:MAG: antiterminator LoaP [Erysipelotrichaceae bacterium]|nr:antiterminator LoaP [Erysipelotrichaceae bacterium]